MLILSGGAFGYRIAVEEAALLSVLGEPYARYTRRHLATNPRSDLDPIGRPRSVCRRCATRFGAGARLRSSPFAAPCAA